MKESTDHAMKPNVKFTIDILFSGFSGKLDNCSLGWGTCALIRDGKRNVLLDTGNFGLRFYLDKLLAEKNISRPEIDTVLITHSHFDHVGNVGFFPNAVFVISEEEWEYAREYRDKDLYIPGSEWDLLKNCKRHIVKNDWEEIRPGITTLMTPGHTPGSLSFVLHQSGGERWVLVGDAVKNRIELATGETPMSFDPARSSVSIKKILKSGHRILPGHDGWLINKNGIISAEGCMGKSIQTTDGITANGGRRKVEIFMD